MSTPSGLLRWGQAGRYTGWDDRVVITALSGRRVGVVVPVRMAPAAAPLAITLEANWLAVAPCGDGTVAVLTSPVAVSVTVWPAEEDAEAPRRDELRAEVSDPESASWVLSVMPEGSSSSGLVLGWITVPPGAESAADMTLEAREQDFATGGSVPGPPGPVGPQGPPGPPGMATLIVGSFGAIRTPAELPADGFIPANWDGPGHPANDVQVLVGWSLIYEPDSGMWTFVGEESPNGEPWIHPGFIQGPPGEPGPPGPAPDYGVGPWRTLSPTITGGLLATTLFRFRVLAALNCVQYDVSLHYNAGSGGHTWPAPLPADAVPSFLNAQPRMYANQGNGPTPAANGQLTRLQFNTNGTVASSHNSPNQGGVSTFNLIIPRDAAAGGELIASPGQADTIEPRSGRATRRDPATPDPLKRRSRP